MKLLFCRQCSDIIVLRPNKERSCECGNVKGMYTDDLNAIYSGPHAIPLGFTNSSLEWALRYQPEDGRGKEFTAFVIPKRCPTLKRVN